MDRCCWGTRLRPCAKYESVTSNGVEVHMGEKGIFLYISRARAISMAGLAFGEVNKESKNWC